jgi:hypothetical protein
MSLAVMMREMFVGRQYSGSVAVVPFTEISRIPARHDYGRTGGHPAYDRSSERARSNPPRCVVACRCLPRTGQKRTLAKKPVARDASVK